MMVSVLVQNVLKILVKIMQKSMKLLNVNKLKNLDNVIEHFFCVLTILNPFKI